jgi:hypothetical protein
VAGGSVHSGTISTINSESIQRESSPPRVRVWLAVNDGIGRTDQTIDSNKTPFMTLHVVKQKRGENPATRPFDPNNGRTSMVRCGWRRMKSIAGLGLEQCSKGSV